MQMSLWTALGLALRRRLSGAPGKRPPTRIVPPPPRPAFAAVPPADAARPAVAEPLAPHVAPMPLDIATPIALPIGGLGESGERAPALEAVLQQLRGVLRAYVSPFTRLAYLDYEPGQVTEDQLVGAIAGAGFSVDDQRRRFAWRRF